MKPTTPLALAFALVACGGEHPAQQPIAESPPIAVEILTVTHTSMPDVHEASGEIRGLQTTELSAKVLAHVESVNVRAGDAITRGQLLVQLNAPELDAGHAAAAAGLAQAKAGRHMAAANLTAATADAKISAATHQRFELMRERNAATKQELDEIDARFNATEAAVVAARERLAASESAIKQAAAALAGAKAMQDYSSVLAPFDGRVIERSVDPGALAAPGRTLLVVEETGGARAVTWLEESLARLAKLGDPVTVALDGTDGWVPATIAEIVPRVDPRTRSVLIKVDLDELPKNHGLEPGTFARVRFSVGESDRVLIPKSAISVRGQLERVLVVDDGRAQIRLVTIGTEHDGKVEILSGLVDGESIVADWSSSVTDGSPVERR